MIDYAMLNRQIESLAEGCRKPLPVLANASALLWENLPGLNWAGFYLLSGEDLILGPFQGRIACTVIRMGRGVCGAAAVTRQTQRVDDVHLFPGHIACDAASRSELVVPMISCAGELKGVLDLDSPSLSRFSAEDQQGLESFVQALMQSIDWSSGLI